MFRTFDRRGYLSNPSPIYQVELVDDGGAVYLVVKVVYFKPKIPKESTKSMRKYVQIVPTLKQSNLVAAPSQSIFESEGLPEDVKLGNLFTKIPPGSDHAKNPREFKIRFTSKSSGKMFDLNIRFEHEHKGINFDPDADVLTPEEITSAVQKVLNAKLWNLFT